MSEVFTPDRQVSPNDYSNSSVVFKNSAGIIKNAAISASEVLGRKATGEITALTAADLATILAAYLGGGASTGYFYQENNANNAVDSDHDIDFGAGLFRSDDDTTDIQADAITKRGDAAWAAGDGNGMIDSGSIAANTLYYFFSIYDDTNELADVLMSTSLTAPSMPLGYTKKRVRFAIRTDASANFVPFLHSGNFVRYLDPQTEVNDATITDDTYETATLLVPPRAEWVGYENYGNSTAGNIGAAYSRPNGANDQSANLGTAAETIFVSSSSIRGIGGRISDLVDDSSQMQYTCEEVGGAATLTIALTGYKIDFSTMGS